MTRQWHQTFLVLGLLLAGAALVIAIKAARWDVVLLPAGLMGYGMYALAKLNAK